MNLFQGLYSASLCSLESRNDNPVGRTGPPEAGEIDSLESILGLIIRLEIRALGCGLAKQATEGLHVGFCSLKSLWANRNKVTNAVHVCSN